MKGIAIIGFGVVGSGVYEIIKENSAQLLKSCGDVLKVKRVLDIRDFSQHEEKEIFTKDFSDILNDPEIEIVVETMGGVRFAYEYTKAALESKKSVVTSNKELVASHGDEFFAIAKKNNVRYLYEASVGGGIPIIRPLANDIAANNVVQIAGILNGTTNYILTKMFKENDSFENALKNAQELGYAEKDPTADVDGIDACRKIAILMSLVTKKKIDCKNVHTDGIRHLTAEDVTYAAALDRTIKLIGCGFVKDGKVNASVEPMLVAKENLLSGVEDVFNAVTVKGDMVGNLMFYGRGAGKLPTASAVVADIIDIARSDNYTDAFSWEKEDAALEISYSDVRARFFVRVKKELKENVNEEFGNVEIIRGVSDIGFVSPKMSVKELEERLSRIGGCVKKIRLL